MIRTALLALVVFLVPSISHAREYGHYDLNRIRTISDIKAGQKYAIDKDYLDQVLHDLGFHARNYPPQFDNPQDQNRAAQDVIAVSGMLDAVTMEPKPDAELFVRAGFLGIIGKNLNIPGSGPRAEANFKKLLAAKPSHPEGNYLYGIFLADVGKPKKAIPHLDKALAAGVGEAAYTLGMVHKTLGNKQKAIANLESFRKSNPYSSESVDKLIDEIRNAKAKKKKDSR